MVIKNTALKKRIITISYDHTLSHIGSCLTAVDIIEEIYSQKKPEEKFILSAGHAGLALYCVIEKHKGLDAETIFNHHGVHPDRCSTCHIDCSTGSLGQGLPIAVGMALADRSKNVYCLISDGESTEGSIWEALNLKRSQRLNNLRVYVNYNGWGAYRSTKNDFPLDSIFDVTVKCTDVDDFPFLKGQDAHYVTLTEEAYNQAMEILK